MQCNVTATVRLDCLILQVHCMQVIIISMSKVLCSKTAFCCVQLRFYRCPSASTYIAAIAVHLVVVVIVQSSAKRIADTIDLTWPPTTDITTPIDDVTSGDEVVDDRKRSLSTWLLATALRKCRTNPTDCARFSVRRRIHAQQRRSTHLQTRVDGG